jgi:hypothetical protein
MPAARSPRTIPSRIRGTAEAAGSPESAIADAPACASSCTRRSSALARCAAAIFSPRTLVYWSAATAAASRAGRVTAR